MHWLPTTTELDVGYFEDFSRKLFTICEVTLKLRAFSKTVQEWKNDAINCN